jgi:PAS domain S-box-containing protein
MNKAKILVVDDDEHIRDYFVAVLSLEDRYTLASAADGEQALQYIERDPPDLVLLDFMMPKFNGIDVLRNLKALAETDPRYEDIECVMVTGKGDEGIAAAVVRAGAADYLSKPCPTERLLTTVEKVLQYRQMQVTRRREEKRRLRMRSLLQRILDLTIEGFMLTDLEGRVSFANHKAAYILGLSSASQARDRTVEELLGAKAAAHFRSRLEQGLDEDFGAAPATLARGGQGEEVVLSFTLHAFHDETGKRAGILFRFQDLMEVKRRLDDSLSGASREITRYFIPLHPPTPSKARPLTPGREPRAEAVDDEEDEEKTRPF